MAAKRVLHQDPEYEAIPAELQEKRIKLLEDSVRKQTKKKIETIIKVNFDQEKNSKSAEIDAVDETLYDCRLTLDRLRACAVTHYYANLGQEQTSLENSMPSIHPTVKKYLGKSPRDYDSLGKNSNENSRETTGESSSDVSYRISSNNPSCISNEASKRVEAQTLYLSPNKDISTRAPRFKRKSKIVIGNISKFIPVWQRDESDQSTHKWMIYVRGDRNSPNIESFVQKVRFLLHPSYRPTDIVEICNPPFHLVKRGWGEFPVRVQLHFHDLRNKPVDIIHNLKLDKTYTGLQTLGAETVVELQLFKADGNGTSSSCSTLSSISSFPSTSNFYENHEPYNESNSNSTAVSIKMEIDADSEASVDATVNNMLPPSSFENHTQSEKLSYENGPESISNVTVFNENSSSTSVAVDVENRTTTPKPVVPNMSISNNPGLGSKPPVKNNTIPNGVNTAYLKCTDTAGRVLLVPQSSLLCIKSQKSNAKTPTNTINNTSLNASKQEKVLNTKTPVPSYILKVVPNQDSGQNQVLLIPMAEKKVQCADSKQPAESSSKPNSLIANENHLTSVAEDKFSKKSKTNCWQQELLNVKLEYYKSFVELLKRVCNVFPLVNKDVDRSIHPFCATSLEEFLRWNIGKQRASEWGRAGMVRIAILYLIHKNKLPSLAEESVWPRHTIMSWCRKNGFVPMTSEKMTLLPEPKWSGVELCSVSNADDLISTLKEENHSVSNANEDDEEIEVLEEIDIKPLVSKNNQNQEPVSHVPHLNDASVFVKEIASQVGINIKPVELEPSIYGPAVEEMILAACRGLATDLIQSSVFAGYNRLGGQLCPEEITVSDVYSSIKENPQFDFLNNSYLGIPKEARGDT